MRLKKMILTAVVALACSLAFAPAAFAESSSVSWNVEFNADAQMVSDYDQDKINSALRDMQPGDDLTLTVNIKNTNSRSTDWYMSSAIKKTLEETADRVDATGGAYTYKLSYDNRELFSSSTIGGTGSTQGLKEITKGTETMFYLATLATGESGTVKLEMTLDGESQGNGYMVTDGELQLNFAVEYTDGGQTPDSTKAGFPKTGDDLFNAVQIAILAIGVAFLLLAVLSFKKDISKRGDK